MCHFTNSCVYNVALLKEILTICIFHEFHITTDCFDKTHDICIFFLVLQMVCLLNKTFLSALVRNENNIKKHMVLVILFFD